MGAFYRDLLSEVVKRSLDDLQRLFAKEAKGKKLSKGELEEGVELFEFFRDSSKEVLYCFSDEFEWEQVPDLILQKSPQIRAAVLVTDWDSYEGRKEFA